ncbi:Protein spaetzle [Anthophora retusa]
MLIFEISFSKSFVVHNVTPKDYSQVTKPVSICEHETYCEDTLNYPIDTILQALEKNPQLRDYANSDEMDTYTQMKDELEEEPLCVSTEQIIFPKLGVTKDMEWKYIVNHKNLTQSVRIETCLEQGKPCRVIEGFAEGYYTKCKQKYIYRQLLAIAEDGSINRESFRFPTSCCCHIDFQADKFLHSFNLKRRRG